MTAIAAKTREISGTSVKIGKPYLKVAAFLYSKRVDDFQYSEEGRARIERCNALKDEIERLESWIDEEWVKGLYNQGFFDGMAFMNAMTRLAAGDKTAEDALLTLYSEPLFEKIKQAQGSQDPIAQRILAVLEAHHQKMNDEWVERHEEEERRKKEHGQAEQEQFEREAFAYLSKKYGDTTAIPLQA